MKTFWLNGSDEDGGKEKYNNLHLNEEIKRNVDTESVIVLLPPSSRLLFRRQFGEFVGERGTVASEWTKGCISF